jgi:hypothetical protein
MSKRQEPWGNEKHMRETIAKRRAENVRLRAAGGKWREIADALGYGSLQHARVDWLRAQKSLANDAEMFTNDEARPLRKPRPA